jgi:hypothetical protein
MTTMNLGANTWMQLNKDSKTEIIGFIVDNVIHTGTESMALVKSLQRADGVMTKDVARFMSAMDLGPKWDELARCPTILIWDKGEMYFPKDLAQS